MQAKGTRRPNGSGSLFLRSDVWYGQFRVRGRIVKRKVGPKRAQGTREGLTRTQAERRLRDLIAETKFVPVEGRATLEEAAARYISHLELVMRRKKATLTDYRIYVRRHLVPYFGNKALIQFVPGDIDGYQECKAREGYAVETILNHLSFLHGLFAFAVKRDMAEVNVVAAVDRPRSTGASAEIRFLDLTEVEALLDEIEDDYLGHTDHSLYLTAVMTGLRQGELVALRWRDVDWNAAVVRVRRNFTRGRFGTPKSKRSSRAVPMAERVVAALREHYKRSEYQGRDDLVFCHPQTGKPYDASKLRKRFKRALRDSEIREVRFHDLRHTFGTQMAGAGVSMRTLQEWMGHRDISTTLRYADYAPDPVREAALVGRAFTIVETDEEPEPLALAA